MNEFELIHKYFAPLSKDGLINDAAILDVPQGKQLVVTSDTLNEGIHFMESSAPADIAHKSLLTNISDLYAMGAEPLCYQLCIAFSDKPEESWVVEFTKTLQDIQTEHNIVCSGGDTTTINGALSISITAMGLLQKGRAWTRSGAKEGDAVVLNNTIGDAYIGLQILKLDLKTHDDNYFIRRYNCPDVKPFRGNPNAAIDISDGLAADLSHICKASNIGAVIDTSKIPLSDQAQKVVDSGGVTYQDIITGGDDYTLLMTMPEHDVTPDLHKIGTVTGDKPVFNDLDGTPICIKNTGWTHF